MTISSYFRVHILEPVETSSVVKHFCFDEDANVFDYKKLCLDICLDMEL